VERGQECGCWWVGGKNEEDAEGESRCSCLEKRDERELQDAYLR